VAIAVNHGVPEPMANLPGGIWHRTLPPDLQLSATRAAR